MKLITFGNEQTLSVIEHIELSFLRSLDADNCFDVTVYIFLRKSVLHNEWVEIFDLQVLLLSKT